jgi:hypothetical protein
MTARRIGSQIETTHLGHVRLYRDELEKVAAAVGEVGDVTILCDDWELTDPADLGNDGIPDLLSRVSIGAQRSVTEDGRSKDEPVMAVALNGDEACVTIFEPGVLTEGALSRIQRIVGPRRRRWHVPLAKGASGRETLASLGAIGGVLALVGYISPLLTPLFSIVAIAAVFFVLFARNRRVSSAIVVNAYRKDRPSFWQRTRDDWVVATVMLVLGAIVGGFVGYWVNQIT